MNLRPKLGSVGLLAFALSACPHGDKLDGWLTDADCDVAYGLICDKATDATSDEEGVCEFAPGECDVDDDCDAGFHCDRATDATTDQSGTCVEDVP